MTSLRRPTQDELDDLVAAAKQGNTKRLEHLIQEKQLPIETHIPGYLHWNSTLFLISCQYGQLAAMERLLQLGADVNAVDGNGYNAMHLAAANGHEGVLQWLLQKHPHMIKQTTNHGYNVMHLAALNGHESLVDLILQKHPDMIKQTTNSGNNAMHLAAMNGHESLVDWILQKHPDMIKQTNNDGDTPLDLAVIMGKPSVVWTILKVHKVDITHCQETLRERAKRLLAAEEARRAKSQNVSSSSEGNTNASTQGG